MADQQDKFIIEAEVNKKSFKDAYEDILSTTELFYKRLGNLNDKYQKELSKGFTKDLAGRTYLHTQIMKMSKKEAAVGYGGGGVTGGGKVRDRKTDAAKAAEAAEKERKKQLSDRRKGLYGVSSLAKSVGSEVGAGKLSGPVTKAAGNVIDNVLGGPVKDAGKYIASLGDSSSMLGKTFQGLGKTVEMLGGALGSTIATVLTVMFQASQAQKEYRRKLLVGVGGTGGGNIPELATTALSFGIKNNPLSRLGDSLKMTMEESTSLMNSLMQSGVSIKSLGGGYAELAKTTDIAGTAARNLGLSFDDSGKMVSEFYSRTGADANKMSKIFTTLTMDIKASGMTTNAFLSTMQSVSSQFSVFLDQTLAFSKILTGLSTSGLTQKQSQMMTSAVGGAGARTMDEGNTRAAFMGPDIYKKLINKQTKKLTAKLSEIEADAKIGIVKDTKSLTTNQRLLRSMQAAEKGTELMGDHMMDIPVADQMEAIFEAATKQSGKDLSKLATDGEWLRIMGTVLKRSPEDTKEIIDTFGIFVKNQEEGLTDDDMKAKEQNAEWKKMSTTQYAQMLAFKKLGEVGTATLEEEALNRKHATEIAKMTIGDMKSAPELTNTLLVLISDILDNMLREFGKFLGFKADFKTLGDRIANVGKVTMNKLIKKNKEGVVESGDNSDKKINELIDTLQPGSAALYYHGDKKTEGPIKSILTNIEKSGKDAELLASSKDAKMMHLLKDINIDNVSDATDDPGTSQAYSDIHNIVTILETLAAFWMGAKFVKAMVGIYKAGKAVVGVAKGVAGAGKVAGEAAEVAGKGSGLAIETAAETAARMGGKGAGEVAQGVGKGLAKVEGKALGKLGGRALEILPLVGQLIGAGFVAADVWSMAKKYIETGKISGKDLAELAADTTAAVVPGVGGALAIGASFGIGQMSDDALGSFGPGSGTPSGTAQSGESPAVDSSGNKMLYLVVEGQQMRAFIKEVMYQKNH